MVVIIWSELAIEDLKSIYDYIAKNSSVYAKRQVNKITERVKSLSKFPNIGRIVPEFNLANIKELVEENYRIVYKIECEQITILRIHHSSSLLKHF